MLDFLFPRLTAGRERGTDLFEAITSLARQPHWYVDGEVPDTLDGRFAVLTSLAALVLVRLESEGETGNLVSVALTERFIAVMEAEHRELGLGDPTLGKTVRRLVGSLARRTDLWRAATNGELDWPAATRESLYKESVPSAALDHSAQALDRLWAKFEATPIAAIEQGKL
jgi:cytochrome b pre-mRNA-processing protein 3